MANFGGDYYIRVQASDVTLRGNGHFIDGENDDSGQAAILVDGESGARLSSVEIRNFQSLSDFQAPVHLRYTDNSTIRDLRAQASPAYGIRLDNSNDNHIENVHVRFNGGGEGGAGIFLSQSHRTTILHSNVSANVADGIRASWSPDTVVGESTVDGNGGAGILISEGSERAAIFNVTANDNRYGLVLDDGNDAGTRDFLGGNLTLHGNTEWAFYHSAGQATSQPNVTLANVSLDSSTRITMRPNNVGVRSAPAPDTQPNGTIGIGDYVEVAHANTDFETNVTLALHYSDAEVTDINVSSLRLWLHDSGTWTELPSDVVTSFNAVVGPIDSYGSGGAVIGVFGNASNATGDTLTVDVNPDSVTAEDGTTDTTEDSTTDETEDSTDEETEETEEQTEEETEEETDDGTTSSGSASTVVTREEDTSETQVTVSNAESGESTTVEMPEESSVGDASVEEISVTPEVDGDFSMNVQQSPEPLETSPEFESDDGTTPLGYMSVDHSISNEEISEATITYRVSEQRVEELNSRPEAVSLYRHDGTEWVEQPTEFVGRENGEILLQTTADGLSEWTAAAKRPRLNVTDTSVDLQAATTDQEVTIQVFVENTGGTDGVYEAQLLLNDETVERRERTVPNGGTVAVNFERTFGQPGLYEVRVNDVFVGEVNVSAAEESVEVDTEGAGTVQAADSENDTSTDGEGGGGSIPVLPVGIALVLIAGAGLWYYLTQYQE